MVCGEAIEGGWGMGGGEGMGMRGMGGGGNGRGWGEIRVLNGRGGRIRRGGVDGER